MSLRVPAEVHLQVIAEVRDAVEFCVPADFLEAASQKGAQLVHCRFVVAGGLDFYQLADGFCDGVFPLGKETEAIRGFAGGGLGPRWLRLFQNLLHMHILAVFRR